MKILQINAVCEASSTGRTTKEFSEALRNCGYLSFVATPDTANNENSFKICTKIGMKFHALFSRIFGLQGYFSTFSTHKLIKYIKKEKFDIVHLRNLHSNYINIYKLLKFLAKKDVATVVTLHDCFFYTGKCTHYTIDKCYKWQENCGNCARKKRDNGSWFFDFSKKMLNDKRTHFGLIKNLAVTGVSDWITSEAKKSILKNAKIIRRIYNWVDLDIFKPQNTDELRRKLGLENKFIILGMAGKWLSDKNFNNTLKICRNLTDDMKIILIGCKNVENLPDNVIGVPYINNVKELSKYYSLADCFVNLSFEDTFGKVVAEALACGTPAIVYNSTALPELIGTNCGFVVEMNDVDKILECIYEMKTNTKQYYLEYCIEFVKKNFNKEQNIKHTIDLYKDLIGV